MNEVTSSNSHAVLIAEISDLKSKVGEFRDQLWQVIAAGKKVIGSLPDKEKMILLDSLIAAERRLLR